MDKLILSFSEMYKQDPSAALIVTVFSLALIAIFWRLNRIERVVTNGLSHRVAEIHESVAHIRGLCEERGKICPGRK